MRIKPPQKLKPKRIKRNRFEFSTSFDKNSIKLRDRYKKRALLYFPDFASNNEDLYNMEFDSYSEKVKNEKNSKDQ
jgi:hypothetical protein